MAAATPPPAGDLAGQLKAIPFLAGLGDDGLLQLARRARWREYEAGEVVVLEGEALPGLYFLQYGWVKIVKMAPSGREQILRFIEPGETFNELGVFAGRANPATAIALEAAGIWLIWRDDLLRLLADRPEFAQQVIAVMAERILYLVGLVSDLSLRPVTGRLARLLLAGAEDDVLERPRWFTQAELAARLGTVPDVVQRALRGLEKDGLIAVTRQRVEILDRVGLERLVE